MGRKFASNEDRTNRENKRKAYINKKEKEMLEKRKASLEKIAKYSYKYDSCEEYYKYDFSNVPTKEVLEIEKKLYALAKEEHEKIEKEKEERWEAILKKQREKEAKRKAEEKAVKEEKERKAREDEIARQIAYEKDLRRQAKIEAEWEARSAQYKAEERARSAELNRNQWRVLPNGSWRLYPSTPNGEVQWKNDCMMVMQWKK